MNFLRKAAIFLLLGLSSGILSAQETNSTVLPCFQTQGTCTALNAPSVETGITNARPSITLSGANPLSLNIGATFTDPGYSAYDPEEGNLTSRVIRTGTVNTAVVGTYTLTYNVTDSGGLSAIQQVRTVNVVSSTNANTYTLTSTLCSFVWVTNVYYGYGQHDSDMRVGGWGDWYYSLLKCNQTGLPTTATKAVLRLFQYGTSSGSRGQMYLDRVTGTWDNSTKWYSIPSSVNIQTLPAPVDNQWYEVDITALYNGWQSGAFVNQGIMLRPVSNINVFNFFRSPEYADPAYRPQLAITTGTIAPVLTGACSVNGSLSPITLQIGSTAFYGAGYTGGVGPIHYQWIGAMGGDSSSATQVYNVAGVYNASVKLTDSAPTPQQVTVTCPIVTVPQPASPLSVSCGFFPSSILLGATTSIVAGAAGGYAPYTYKLPGDSVFGSNATKTYTGTSIGTFGYTVQAKDGRGTIVTSSPCSFTVNLGPISATKAVATPNPIRRLSTVFIQLWGSNFLNGTTQVSILGPGCLLYTSCPIPVTVVSSGYIESRVTMNTLGSYTVWLRNGSGSWILAPVLVIYVTN